MSTPPRDTPPTDDLTTRLAHRLTELLPLVPPANRTEADDLLLAEAQLRSGEPGAVLGTLTHQAVTEIARTATDPSLLRRLMAECDDPAVARLGVARAASVFDDELIRDIGQTVTGIAALAQNPSITGPHAHQVVDALDRELQTPRASDDDEEQNLMGALKSMALRGSVPPGHPIHDTVARRAPQMSFAPEAPQHYIPCPSGWP